MSQVQTNTRPQFCKLLCKEGRWKGPYCGDDPFGVTGDLADKAGKIIDAPLQRSYSSLAVYCLTYRLV